MGFNTDESPWSPLEPFELDPPRLPLRVLQSRSLFPPRDSCGDSVPAKQVVTIESLTGCIGVPCEEGNLRWGEAPLSLIQLALSDGARGAGAPSTAEIVAQLLFGEAHVTGDTDHTLAGLAWWALGDVICLEGAFANRANRCACAHRKLPIGKSSAITIQKSADPP